MRSPRSADAPVVSTSTNAKGSSDNFWISENCIGPDAWQSNQSELGPNDIALKRQRPVHEALRAAANAMVPFPDFGRKDVQANAWRNLLPELAAFQSAESDEAFPANELLDVDAGQLRGGFDHQHARQ